MNTMIKPTSPFQLTTSDCDFFLPGIADYYGADLPIDLFFKVLEVGEIGITKDDQEMSGTGTLETQFWVELADGTKDLAASITLAQTSFGFTALVDNMSVMLQIAQVKSSDLSVDFCSFGTLSALKLKLELNNFLRLYMGHINAWLDTLPITIPSQIGGLFSLSDLTIEYFDDYIYAGATPTFIGPQAIYLQ